MVLRLLFKQYALLRFHKRSGNAFLIRLGGNENILLVIPDEVKKDMSTIAKMAE